MERTPAAELRSGEKIDQVFLVNSKQLKTTRQGSLYIDLDLADKSGTVSAKVWNATQEFFDSFQPDDFVNTTGLVETYQNRIQLKLDSLHRVPDSDIRVADFLPHTEADIDGLWQRLREIAGEVKHPHLAELLSLFFADEEFCRRFETAPAATRYHHAVIGGLLEHTTAVAELALRLLKDREEVDSDLLIAGAILHDIGKTKELAFTRSFRYTDEGRLNSHLVLAVLMIEEKVRQIDDFSTDHLMLLRHMILSHHGEHQWGSPALPATAEAIALHYLDNLDAKLNGYANAVQESSDNDDNWTTKQAMFDRKLFKWPKSNNERDVV